MQWDLFGRVVDNHGDIGFGWRLAADLAARGERVRFWIDDASALGWMAPRGAAGVRVARWDDATRVAPGDVVVELFGGGLPDPFLAAMAGLARPPPWIDVEYLSAEPDAERSHGLPSPQQIGPGAGLTRWFFFPGFGAGTGGLLREADLVERQDRFSRSAFLHSLGVHDAPGPPGGPRVASLFCYGNAMLPSLLDALAHEPALLLATAGHASRQVGQALGPILRRGRLRAVLLPLLEQPDYDRLLWSCDLNFVRGEDSWIRAQWAGVPFVWQAYPQDDGAHVAKLEAFLDRFVDDAPRDLGSALRRVFRAWNGLEAWPGLPHLDGWREHCVRWRARLLAQEDLGTLLLRFAASKMLK